MAYRAPEFLSLRVKENKSGRVLEAILCSQRVPGFALNIQPEYDQMVLVLGFDPIHDGFHRCAGKSVRRLELEQDGHSLSYARLDLGGVMAQGDLAWVEEDPPYKQSKHQYAKDQKLGPIWFPAKQDEPGDDHQDRCDPNSGILIEDLH